mmetsp:Transcript_3878/g.5676  ORF Transcript_3878/g.5676 Transcript_3878/m.5676 type:complete len:138 (+) Transcript_3878:161-574(+)
MFNSEAADAQKEALAITRAHAEGLVLGTRVECKYANSINYYWGKINWVNGDGTFDILYEDGDQEFHVLRRFFRVDEGLQPGDMVEARTDEDNRFVRGIISKVRPGELYDITFDDNLVRRNVRRVLIRRPEDEGSSWQ